MSEKAHIKGIESRKLQKNFTMGFLKRSFVSYLKCCRHLKNKNNFFFNFKIKMTIFVVLNLQHSFTPHFPFTLCMLFYLCFLSLADMPHIIIMSSRGIITTVASAYIDGIPKGFHLYRWECAKWEISLSAVGKSTKEKCKLQSGNANFAPRTIMCER